MSVRPCEGSCGRTVNARGGRLYCVGCTEQRAQARKSERKREVKQALARGEAPPPPKQNPMLKKKCAACGVPFTTNHARRTYCSKACGEHHRYATGTRINAPREREPRSVGIGPATPLIKTDVAGMRRRAISDAMDGLPSSALEERGVPANIIREAMRVATASKRKRKGDFGLLPFGLPA